MARLLRLLPDSASPHKPRSVDPSKIAFVSLAAMANQAKPLRGVTPSRRSKVPGGGRRWFTNGALAHVRTSGGPASPTQRLFRVARSSPNLCARPSLTRSNRRGTGPVCPVVWEGWRREASPYPDLGQIPAFPGRPTEGKSPPEAGVPGCKLKRSNSVHNPIWSWRGARRRLVRLARSERRVCLRSVRCVVDLAARDCRTCLIYPAGPSGRDRLDAGSPPRSRAGASCLPPLHRQG